MTWNQAERAKKGVGDYIFGARGVDNVTGKFGDVGKMAHLSGGPQWRGAEKDMVKRFMTGEQGKFSGSRRKRKWRIKE